MNFRNSLTFCILNPDSDFTALRKTTLTIAKYYPECKTLCAVGKREDPENKQYAEVIKGGNTITSLIDASVRNSNTDWCFIVAAGTYLRSKSLRKYECFLKNNKDILYPIINKKFPFDEAAINGILMPKKAIEEVGDFGDNNHSIQLVKMLWALRAIEKHYIFKGIVGARLV